MKPLAIDLFCGLGGWTEGLLAEGYRVGSLLFARFVERQLIELARQLERFEQTWRR